MKTYKSSDKIGLAVFVTSFICLVAITVLMGIKVFYENI